LLENGQRGGSMNKEENLSLTILEMKKKFRKNIILAVTSLAVLIVVGIAWFINNSQVDIGEIRISADNKSFELGSTGESGIYDTVIKGITLDTTGITSSAKYSINWLMTDKSNIGNYSENGVDFSKEDRKDYAIEPGSKGNLTFYIIPKMSGTQTFHMNLSVSPYKATVTESTNAIDSVKEVGLAGDSDADKYARQFLSGHILFFWKEESEEQWIQENTFDITITNAVADQKYTYTIDWEWPLVFAELVLKEEDTYLNGHTPIFSENEKLRKKILEEMSKNPQKYFYNSLTKSPLQSENSLVEDIADIYKKSPKGGGTDGYNVQNFVDLSSFYNQADQMIGSQISFILLELSAELGGKGE
jgi:hypothetical protein